MGSGLRIVKEERDSQLTRLTDGQRAFSLAEERHFCAIEKLHTHLPNSYVAKCEVMLMVTTVARLMLSLTASYPLGSVFLIQVKLPCLKRCTTTTVLITVQCRKEKKNPPVERVEDERFCARLKAKCR